MVVQDESSSVWANLESFQIRCVRATIQLLLVEVHDHLFISFEEVLLGLLRVHDGRSLVLDAKAKSVWSHIPVLGPDLEVNLLEVGFSPTVIDNGTLR